MGKTLDDDKFDVRRLSHEGNLRVGDLLEVTLKDSFHVEIQQNKLGDRYVVVMKGEHVPEIDRKFYAVFEGYHMADTSKPEEPYRIDLFPANANRMRGERINEDMVECYLKLKTDC